MTPTSLPLTHSVLIYTGSTHKLLHIAVQPEYSWTLQMGSSRFLHSLFGRSDQPDSTQQASTGYPSIHVFRTFVYRTLFIFFLLDHDKFSGIRFSYIEITSEYANYQSLITFG